MIGAIVQARMSSKRLPGKVLLPLAGSPVLAHVVERARHSSAVDVVVVATSTEKEDDAIVSLCKERGYEYFRGSRDDVLSRYAKAAQQYDLETVVRITSDCPLIDPHIIDLTIEKYKASNCDYLSNAIPGERTFPRGLDCEVFSATALFKAEKEAKEPFEREHVTPYIWQNKHGSFRVGPILTAPAGYASSYRLTLDYPEDYELLKHLYERLYVPDGIVPVPEVIRYLDAHPDIAAINAKRDEEYPVQGIRI